MQAQGYFIGIDLHKAVIQVCVLDEEGRPVAEQRFRGRTLMDGHTAVDFLSRWKRGGRYDGSSTRWARGEWMSWSSTR
jgi:hypothetical protein